MSMQRMQFAKAKIVEIGARNGSFRVGICSKGDFRETAKAYDLVTSCTNAIAALTLCGLL